MDNPRFDQQTTIKSEAQLAFEDTFWGQLIISKIEKVEKEINVLEGVVREYLRVLPINIGFSSIEEHPFYEEYKIAQNDLNLCLGKRVSLVNKLKEGKSGVRLTLQERWRRFRYGKNLFEEYIETTDEF